MGHTQQLNSSTTRSAHVVSLDPFTCTSCEGAFQLGVSSRVEGPPSGCSVQSGGGTAEDALFVWEQVLSGNGDIIARGWRTVDGDVASLGGGCGRGGTNRASCARSPATAFSFRLRDAVAAAPSVFLLSGSQSSIPCGACNLIPDLTGGLQL